MHSFSIIIVSWNALNHLKRFLPSVAETNYPDIEIILADNASSDGSAEWVKENYPKVKVATFDQNYGYCGGNNRGAKHANGDILVFLNNDVKVEPDWITHLDQCFTNHPEAAAIQPKMRSFSNPDEFEYAGAAGGFLDKYGYPFCRGRIFDTVEKDEGQYDTPEEILWASGAAMAIKSELFDEVRGFDEDFEFHMEEIDLCWQLWNRGHTVRYCPDSVVYHLGGGSMPMGSPRKVYYNYRNNLKMLWKNCSSASLPWRFPVRYGLDIIAAFRSLLYGEWREVGAIIRAHFHFWKSLAETQGKRGKLQKVRTNKEDPPTILPINLIWKYFVKGKRRFTELLFD
ncbi:glycosyltransferase family 2 protein [Aliifodinibius sp. S!AR15-10]|uniref:glycosyltransferase family 2 protein n=1 Tax=Aliifodinibius sp. S!AR15-10 TaxID=2950437 RepID=UPI0028667D62|nr:glycosyltransferase family 2 protein [Aliifodinibius sp. S!AR15-10]MDR8392589.1 glycosyltransferase family 2 protein [Aliifodinibius sp. S!AR15-10]